MGKGIPDRWENYTNMGRQIPGTRFIAFKVPLKNVLLSKLPSSVGMFGPRELIDYCPALGLVIDLTNTNRYYEPQALLSQNIQYEKLYTEGHVVPNRTVVQKFFKIVEKFSEENSTNDKLIGVHCTHGVNRTGYMICRYLIQQLRVPPDQAISDFNSARGHELERANYLDDLRLAPWLPQVLSPSEPFSRGWRRASDGKANGSPEVFTPPYAPHQSRNAMRSRSSLSSPGNNSRRSRSPVERRRSVSATPSPKYGWSPYGRDRLQQMGYYPTSPETRGRKRSASPNGNEPDSKIEPFKSPKFGKLYYEQYYKGHVLPQYDIDFYSRNEGRVGPQRPQLRNFAPVQGDGNRPRKYRGPRPYRTPPKQEEGNLQSTKTPEDGDKSGRFEGPIRRQIFSPPGTSGDRLFSPPDNEYGRRRSQRFQPY